MDLLDYFRGTRPWAQLVRFAQRLPPESHYKTAIVMDPEIAERQARLPEPDGPARVTPLGYSPVVARLDLLADSVAELHATLTQLLQLTAVGKSRRPRVPRQPRPRTALDDARVRVEKEDLRATAAVWFSGQRATDPQAGRWETTRDGIG